MFVSSMHFVASSYDLLGSGVVRLNLVSDIIIIYCILLYNTYYYIIYIIILCELVDYSGN